MSNFKEEARGFDTLIEKLVPQVQPIQNFILRHSQIQKKCKKDKNCFTLKIEKMKRPKMRLFSPI